MFASFPYPLPLVGGYIRGRSLHQIKETTSLHISSEEWNVHEFIKDAARWVWSIVKEYLRNAGLIFLRWIDSIPSSTVIPTCPRRKLYAVMISAFGSFTFAEKSAVASFNLSMWDSVTVIRPPFLPFQHWVNLIVVSLLTQTWVCGKVFNVNFVTIPYISNQLRWEDNGNNTYEVVETALILISLEKNSSSNAAVLGLPSIQKRGQDLSR